VISVLPKGAIGVDAILMAVTKSENQSILAIKVNKTEAIDVNIK
jgi:hypothetical protein